MIFFHALVGVAVLVTNGGAAVCGLVPRWDEEQFWRLSGAGLATLGLQVASGFFALTSTTAELGVVHFVLPLAALAGIVLARSSDSDRRARVAAVAALGAFVAASAALVTGLSGGGDAY
ncbi:MAG TPA: hypothetical protein VI854_07430 [Acidimicrobiia bacterium]|nr:hypothetical protein [Acidimicrobiia bacterium]